MTLSSIRRIVVFGSLNADLVQSIARLPVVGETIRARDLATFLGGKGANQACAVARLGGRALIAGVVGQDAFGDAILAELRSLGVDHRLVRRATTMSGMATIFVLPNGDNSIVISPGANALAGADLAAAAASSLERGDFLLCQLEVPLDAVGVALSAARARGATTILDPAPAAQLPLAVLRSTEILTPNQIEASTLLGWPDPIATLEDARAAAVALRAQGSSTVIVKLGELGCLVDDGVLAAHIPAIPGEVVDTTAAGDTFNGALAVGLAEGRSLHEAARFAVAAASLSVRRRGAIASIPQRSEVDAVMAAR